MGTAVDLSEFVLVFVLYISSKGGTASMAAMKTCYMLFALMHVMEVCVALHAWLQYKRWSI